MITNSKRIVLSSSIAAMMLTMTSACSIITKNPVEHEEPITTTQAAPAAPQPSTGEMALQKVEEAQAKLLFDTGSADLKPEASQSLSELAQVLAQDPNLKLKVDGYTDNTGTNQINDRLAKERAHVVTEVLESQGVAPTQVLAEAHGEKNPVAPNETPEGRAQNRRVTLALQ